MNHKSQFTHFQISTSSVFFKKKQQPCKQDSVTLSPLPDSGISSFIWSGHHWTDLTTYPPEVEASNPLQQAAFRYIWSFNP